MSSGKIILISKSGIRSDPLFGWFLVFTDVFDAICNINKLCTNRVCSKGFVLRVTYGFIAEAQKTIKAFRDSSASSNLTKFMDKQGIEDYSSTIQRFTDYFSEKDKKAEVLNNYRNQSFHFATDENEVENYMKGFELLYATIICEKSEYELLDYPPNGLISILQPIFLFNAAAMGKEKPKAINERTREEFDIIRDAVIAIWLKIRDIYINKKFLYIKT